METEIWPNLIAAAKQAGIPLFLANARLSEKSFRGYRRFRALIAPALRALTAVAAQTEEDAQRLALLGAHAPLVCGNTKYDFNPPESMASLGDEFKARLGARAVVVCASTRDGEESLILEAWRAQTPRALLVIVPRHPERFSVVAELARGFGFNVQRRSDAQQVLPDTQVWIGDSMGEMFAYYHAADLVFIGGSLLPLGGQNLIEPASVGKPVLIGPSCFNFADASRKAIECGAARQVSTAEEMVDIVNQLLSDDVSREHMGLAGLTFSQAHRGASQRIADLIETRLSTGK
jgi:3-deoxy-D-manno-octulosonic-acid transferase